MPNVKKLTNYLWKEKGVSSPKPKEISGIVRDTSTNAIIEICGYWCSSSKGKKKKTISIRTAIKRIRIRKYRYYVLHGNKRAYVHPYPHAKPHSLRTNKDSTMENNLGKLPLCKDLPLYKQ